MASGFFFFWFNSRRLLEPIGFIPPAEAEERYFAMQNDTDMAALIKQNGLRLSRSGSQQYQSRPSCSGEPQPPIPVQSRRCRYEGR